MDRCFHRFEGLELNCLEKHLHLIEHSEREKQLLKCCQDDLTPEKMVQLCSYFNLVDVDDMNQKIQLLTIDDIIKSVKRDRKFKIRDLDSKLKHHDLAIKSITTKIEDSKEEMKKVMIHDLHNFHDIRDVKDMIRARKRRLERIVQRREQLMKEKISLEKSMGFFELKVEDVKLQPLENCPICMSRPANVITQCGHLFCRGCIIKCLKKKYQCPICKAEVLPKDAHEIKLGDQETNDTEQNKERQGRLLKYGTKLTKILELVQKIIESKEKVVIYIQWNPLMNAVKEMLKENNIESAVVFGNTACQNAAIRKFRNTDMSVLLGSIDNTGLDLVNANHLIFSHALVGEDYLVKAAEEQAIARIYRQGQNKTTHVHWCISRDTIEQKIYLQTRL